MIPDHLTEQFLIEYRHHNAVKRRIWLALLIPFLIVLSVAVFSFVMALVGVTLGVKAADDFAKEQKKVLTIPR